MRIEVAGGAPSRLAAASSDAVVALLQARGALRRCPVSFARDSTLELAVSRFLEALVWAAEEAVARAEELGDDLRAAEAAYDQVEAAVAQAAR